MIGIDQIANLPLIPIEKEPIDIYSKRFGISEKQSAVLIGRENQLEQKLKALSIDGSNEPELVAEITKYCATLRALLSNGSVNNEAKQIARLSPEFLNDIPKGHPTENFLDQLDNLKLEGIPKTYTFEVRAIMGILNALAQFRPDLLQKFLVQQAAIIPPSRLDSMERQFNICWKLIVLTQQVLYWKSRIQKPSDRSQKLQRLSVR